MTSHFSMKPKMTGAQMDEHAGVEPSDDDSVDMDELVDEVYMELSNEEPHHNLEIEDGAAKATLQEEELLHEQKDRDFVNGDCQEDPNSKVIDLDPDEHEIVDEEMTELLMEAGGSESGLERTDTQMKEAGKDVDSLEANEMEDMMEQQKYEIMELSRPEEIQIKRDEIQYHDEVARLNMNKCSVAEQCEANDVEVQVQQCEVDNVISKPLLGDNLHRRLDEAKLIVEQKHSEEDQGNWSEEQNHTREMELVKDHNGVAADEIQYVDEVTRVNMNQCGVADEICDVNDVEVYAQKCEVDNVVSEPLLGENLHRRLDEAQLIMEQKTSEEDGSWSEEQNHKQETKLVKDQNEAADEMQYLDKVMQLIMNQCSVTDQICEANDVSLGENLDRRFDEAQLIMEKKPSEEDQGSCSEEHNHTQEIKLTKDHNEAADDCVQFKEGHEGKNQVDGCVQFKEWQNQIADDINDKVDVSGRTLGISSVCQMEQEYSLDKNTSGQSSIPDDMAEEQIKQFPQKTEPNLRESGFDGFELQDQLKGRQVDIIEQHCLSMEEGDVRGVVEEENQPPITVQNQTEELGCALADGERKENKGLENFGELGKHKRKATNDQYPLDVVEADGLDEQDREQSGDVSQQLGELEMTENFEHLDKLRINGSVTKEDQRPSESKQDSAPAEHKQDTEMADGNIHRRVTRGRMRLEILNMGHTAENKQNIILGGISILRKDSVEQQLEDSSGPTRSLEAKPVEIEDSSGPTRSLEVKPVENLSSDKPQRRQLRPLPHRSQPEETEKDTSVPSQEKSSETKECRRLRYQPSRNKPVEASNKVTSSVAAPELPKQHRQGTRKSLRLQK